MTDANFDIDDYIIRYLSGETTSIENQSLSNWLTESTENLSYFNSIRNVWLATAQVTSENTSQYLNTLSEVKDPKRAALPESPKYRFINNEYLNQLLKIAAILFMVVLSGTLVYKQLGKNTHSIKSDNVVVEATLGSRAITTLPDGTKVWLNSGSKLEYGATYNQENREVKLLGEAYFSVITNREKPFIVKTGKLSIKALGTMFNVKAYPEDASIVTTLVKGKVIIEGKDNKNKDFIVQMNPKETVTYFKEKQTLASNNQNIALQSKNNDQNTFDASGNELTSIPVTIIEQVNTELFTSWKDARWVIQKQKLGDLARDFERRYNIKIHFDSDTIKQFHFSGTLENETIEQIMTIMRHTIPVNYKIEKGVINVAEDTELMSKFYKKN